MDSSTTPKEVAVPKVVPMATTFGQKMTIAKRRADRQRAKRNRTQELNWRAARNRREY